ncbi:MAG: hypothetical protein U1E51_17695 [Candidatus Binatia bacterium]|nr:hypothetical protein [Candidatus Binatia bacterium]
MSLPRQTVELSTLLGTQIDESERMTLGLLKEWETESRARTETFLRFHWVRQFIVNFLKIPAVKKELNEKVCKQEGEFDRAILIQDLVEAISEEVEAKRRELFGAIETEKRRMEDLALNHYAEMKRMHRAVQSNINSVAKGQDFEKYIREALAKPIKEIVPLDAARERINKLMEPLKKGE